MNQGENPGKRENNGTRKRSFSCVKTTCTFVGSVAGAGFLSGRELLVFFGGFRIFPLFAGGVAFFFGFYLFLRLGAEYGGFDGVIAAIFGRKISKAVRASSLYCSFCVGTAMLAAANASYPRFKPFFVALLIVFAVFFTRKGVASLGAFNAVFTPVLIFFVVGCLCGNGAFSAPEHTGVLRGVSDMFSALVYASMNVFSVMPSACDFGATGAACGAENPEHFENRAENTRTKTRITGLSGIENGEQQRRNGIFLLVASLSAALLCALSALILSVLGSDKSSYSYPLPLEKILGGNGIVSALSAVGTAVTFVCAFYPISKAAKKRGTGAETFSALAFCLCSFLPFEKIVKIFYPVAGVLGGGVIAYCAVFSLRKKDSAFEKKEKIEEEDFLRKGRNFRGIGTRALSRTIPR